MDVDDTVDQDAADEQEILGVLEELETKFGVINHAAFNPIQILTNVYQYDAEQFSPDAAYAVYSEAATDLLGIQYWITSRGDADLEIRLACLMRAVQESYSTLVAIKSWSGGPATMSMSAEDLALRFSQGEHDKKELGIQTVYKFILVWTRRLQLRHKDDSVYCQKMTAAGLPTHAWVLAKNVGGQNMSTLDKLVGAICTKSKDVNIWKMALAVSTPALTSKLKGCIEIEFPYLITNRAWIAFSDGLYSVYTETFVPYEELKAFGIPNNLAVCSYHRCKFAPAFYRGQSTKGIPLHPLVEVKTPLLDKILNTQELCGHTKFWTMALLGRLLYFSNVLEGWQICLMFKGAAGTGKSTLIEFMTAVYESTDTVTINNDAQSGFGLQALNDLIYMWSVGELKQDFNVDQAQFQQLVSGQRMAINRKNLGAFIGIIRAHGIMAGNTTLPTKWQDNAGSMCRRVAGIGFNNSPPRSEGDLLEKLRTVEMPFILRKINWCYRHAVVLLDGKDFWQCNLLSPHIDSEHKKLHISMNSLRGFLDNASVQLGHNAEGRQFWCPVNFFTRQYYTYCKESFRQAQPWSEELSAVPFKAMNITTRTAKYRWGADPEVTGKILLGVCPTIDLEQMNAGVDNMENPIVADQVLPNRDILAF